VKAFQLSVRPVVERDVDEIVAYLDERSPAAADRFLNVVEEELSRLVAWPGPFARQRLRPGHPSQGNVRRWNLRGFPNHLLLFDLQDDAVVVLRCVHASRITDGFLDDERG